MKRKQRILIGGGLLAIIVACIMFYSTLEEKIYCGTITHKINALQYNKHSATPDPILIVNFDGVGKRELHVSWITFSGNEVSDRVCFERRIADMEETKLGDGGLSSLFLTFGFVGGIVLILAGCGAFNVEDQRGW